MAAESVAMIPIRDDQPQIMELVQLALQNSAPVEVIERLAALQEHMLERQAEAAFNTAMQKCQEKMRRIGTDALNPQTHSKYATYAKIDSALRPIYTAEGFSLSFNTEPTEQPDTLLVVCYVSHRHPDLPLAHTRIYRIAMPSDGKGAKGGDVMTKTHATGSAASYGMRYLLKMIFNVAVGETDDDGNGGGGITQSQGADWVAKIEESTTREETMAAWTNATNAAKHACNGQPDYKAMTIFTEARDKKLTDLKRAR